MVISDTNVQSSGSGIVVEFFGFSYHLSTKRRAKTMIYLTSKWKTSATLSFTLSAPEGIVSGGGSTRVFFGEVSGDED